MSTPSKFVGLRVPHDLNDRIEADAAAQGRSVSNLIKLILTTHYAALDAVADR
ncbi:Arc-like repressor [Rhodococcus phage ReqiPine5]|uniref:Gp56 n=1 Tax=Rhodococcus phage ReqiPine5 TaxID=691963 RepID=D4P831_9CAUD|nr:Arc-like repressor [Rhodococcus phage ReqiPine5]ADD81161.1 gp56 [Rhodococcus phage ReqiPine5]